ncbi:NADP oxidoreductase [Streptomyces sp. NPDC008240]|uniref:NADP oxidoreductase n=1 Tax=Streptomyces sp. NPDC008240 TaxID=3364822 RepID=UPI0036EEDEEC
MGGRTAPSAAATAARIGAAAHGGPAETARYGEAVLLAVPAAAPQVARELAADLAGRTVLDRTVPTRPSSNGGPVLCTAGGSDSAALRVAAAAPHSHVARAFGICHESIWTLPQPAFEGAPLAVPFCRDAPAAEALTRELITSMGCTPLPCGGLERAALLEAAAVFAVGVWWSGSEVRHAFPAPALAPGAVDD